MEGMCVVSSCVIKDQNNVLDFLQTAVEKKRSISENIPNRFHPHTYAHKAIRSLTDGQARRKVIRYKVLWHAAQFLASCRGPGWFTVRQTDEPERQAVIGLGHTSQVWERLQPLAESSHFAQWDVWQKRRLAACSIGAIYCLRDIWSHQMPWEFFWMKGRVLHLSILKA